MNMFRIWFVVAVILSEFIGVKGDGGETYTTWTMNGTTLYVHPTGEKWNSTYGSSYQDTILDVVIEQGVTSIGSYAFYDFPNLRSVEIPDSVKVIEKYAFSRCSSLTSVTLPDSVTVIENYTFGQSGLSHVHIPDGVTRIGFGAFESTNLSTLVLPSSLVTIEDEAFYGGCHHLTELKIPGKVESIGERAFDYCNHVSSIYIPASVSSIGGGAFSNWYALTSIVVDSENKYFSVEDGVLFNYEKTILNYYMVSKNDDNYTVPDGVTYIFPYAFAGAFNLTSIILPDSLERIGKFSFWSAPITHISLPYGLTSIPEGAFCWCDHLKTVVIPESVTSIGRSGFYECQALTTVTIPESVTSIGEHAFYGCRTLVSVFYQGSVEITTSNAFESCNLLGGNVCVPPDYKSDVFCNYLVQKTARYDLCKTFRSLFSKCFKAVYINDAFIQEETIETKEWKKKTNGCVEYFCVNETGQTSTVRNEEQWKTIVALENHCFEAVCSGEEWVLAKRENATEWEKSVPNECVMHQCTNKTGPETIILDEEKWTEFRSQEGHCYEVACEGKDWVLQERENATEWKSRGTHCILRQCNNELGKQSWSICNTSKNVSRFCVNEECIENWVEANEGWYVEIILKGVKREDVDDDALAENISSLSQIPNRETTVGVETDEKGMVNRVFVKVLDEQSAVSVANAVEGIEQGESCAFGVLCEVEHVSFAQHFVSSSLSAESSSHSASEQWMVVSGVPSVHGTEFSVVMLLSLILACALL